jgi:hypothetical protein
MRCVELFAGLLGSMRESGGNTVCCSVERGVVGAGCAG